MKIIHMAHLNCSVHTHNIKISRFERIINGGTQAPFIFYISNYILKCFAIVGE